MRQQTILRIERAGTHWYVSDVHDRSTGVRIDAAVVAVVRQGPTWVEGHILGVHGLSQEVTSNFDQKIFNALGVAAHLKGFSPPPGNGPIRRFQLTPEGHIEKDNQ